MRSVESAKADGRHIVNALGEIQNVLSTLNAIAGRIVVLSVVSVSVLQNNPNSKSNIQINVFN